MLRIHNFIFLFYYKYLEVYKNKVSLFAGIQNAFDVEWKENRLSKSGWAVNASKEAILGYKLIVLSCDPSNARNVSRVSSDS